MKLNSKNPQIVTKLVDHAVSFHPPTLSNVHEIFWIYHKTAWVYPVRILSLECAKLHYSIEWESAKFKVPVLNMSLATAEGSVNKLVLQPSLPPSAALIDRISATWTRFLNVLWSFYRLFSSQFSGLIRGDSRVPSSLLDLPIALSLSLRL